MTNILIAMLCVLMLTTGCRRDNDPVVPPKVAQLTGTWKLVSQPSAYAVTLTFELDTANPPRDITPFRASGESSVNTYNARMSAAVDGTILFYQLGSTKKAGAPAAMQFEQTYLTSLQAVVRYEFTSPTQLVLRYGGETPGTLLYDKIN